MKNDTCGLPNPDPRLWPCDRPHNHSGPHSAHNIDGSSHGETKYSWPNIEQVSRRERIATAIIQGVMANPNYEPHPKNPENEIAAYSIIIADALIKELDK